MRLDHLLSKEVVCGGGFLAVDLARAVDGPGPARGLPLRKDGQLVVSRGLVLAGVAGLSVLV